MIERQYKPNDIITLNGAPCLAHVAERYFHRVFWKQSENLTTESQCSDHAIIMVNTLHNIGQDIPHYVDVFHAMRLVSNDD